MKLNHDCVRDILLYLEEYLFDKPLKIKTLFSQLCDKYQLEDIIYTCQKLKEADFITFTIDSECNRHSFIKSITWKGHNFLDNIRDNKVISIAKESLKTVASYSLEILSNTCAKVIESMISIKL